jgi:hypothetical protein
MIKLDHRVSRPTSNRKRWRGPDDDLKQALARDRNAVSVSGF